VLGRLGARRRLGPRPLDQRLRHPSMVPRRAYFGNTGVSFQRSWLPASVDMK
jgi:hypothetical protein